MESPAPQETLQAKWWQHPALLALACAFAGWLAVERLLLQPLRSPGVDYGKHWIAANWILEGRNPYEGELFLSFNYPLMSGFLYLPLALLSEAAGEKAFEAANFLWLALAMGIIAGVLRPAGDRNPAWAAARHFWLPIVVAGFAMMNSIRSITIATNIDPLNVLLIAACTGAIVLGRDRAAGAALAGLALVKVAPILLAVPLVFLRRWRVLATAFGLLALYGGFLLVSGYWRQELDLYTEVLPAIPFAWEHISLSIHRAAANALWGAGEFTEPQYRRLILAINIACMALYAAYLWAWTRTPGRNPLLLVAFGFQAILVFTPLLETTHLAWALPGLFLAIREASFGRATALPLAALGLTWALLFSKGTTTFYLARVLGMDDSRTLGTVLLMANVACGAWLAWARPEGGSEGRSAADS